MRNMRGIRIRIISIVSGLDVLLLLLLDNGFGELDEFLTSCVHPLVMLVTGLVANFTLKMWSFSFKKTLLAYSTFSSFSC
jgi:hypothetical protein